MLELGAKLEIQYPSSTHVRFMDFPPAYRLRQLQVVSLRDLVADPLTPDEFLRRPFVRRSRWLVSAFEAGTMRFRRFYLGSSLEYAAPSQLRLALYDPDGERPDAILSRPFEPTVADRKLLTRAIQAWRARDFGGRVLRVFTDDLRIYKGRQ